MELYVATETNILKLDYEQGGYASIQGRDDDLDWDEALSQRANHNMKILREGNTLDPLIEKMTNQLIQHKNSNNSYLPDGPIMTQFLYNNPQYHGLRSLEADYFRYVGKDSANNHKTGSFIWILDTLLGGFHHRKNLGEPLMSKKGNYFIFLFF